MSSTVEVGTAKLVLTGDTTGLEVAIDRAKSKQQGLGTVAQAEADKMTAAQRKVVKSLDESIAKVGLDQKQRLQYRVIMQTEGAVRDALLAKINANTAAVTREGRAYEKTVNAVNQYGLTAKQQTAALRQVPAQLTDIFVSLQGGQNPMTVLLQQGGQLRDVFGGVRPVLAALSAQVVGLINPMTLLVAAGAAVAYSFVNASIEQSAFAVATAQAGNHADVTTTKLANMAVAISDIEGVSTSSAADTLAKVATTGRFTAEQILSVATAAEKMRVSTGQSVDETIQAFVRISKDPVAAILELNESQNFLTHATYQHVKELQEQGNMAGAAQVALDAYANRVNNVTTTVGENIGYLQQFAKTVKGLWADISDAVLSIGRATTNADLVRQHQNNIEALEKARERMRSGSIFQGGVYGGMTEKGYAEAIARQRAEIKRLTMLDKVTSTGGSNVVDSVVQKQLDALNEGNRSREERQALEEQQIRNLYAQAGAAKQTITLEQALAASRARYAESLPKGRSGGSARSLANAEASLEIAQIKNQEEAQRNVIQNATKLLQAEYSARIVSADAYYAKQRDLLQQDASAQEKSLTAQIAFLRERNVTGKDSVNVNKQIVDLEQRLAKVRADTATQTVILGIQEKELADKRKEWAEDYKYTLDRSVDSIRKQTDAQIVAIMYGQREAEKQQKLTEIYDQQTEALRKLLVEKQRGAINDQQYEDGVALENERAAQSADAVISGYERMKTAQADWLNGLRSGVADWIDQTQNVAQQINQMTTRALDGTVDALTTLFTTGKNTFKELLADIGKELTRFFAKQAVMKFISMFASSFIGGGSSWDGSLTGNDSSNPFAGIGNGTISWNAKGGVYPGAAGLSALSGTILTRPTPFLFARGAALGVAGEAGAEAIMPLERGPTGKLGVQMYGGGEGQQFNISITNNIQGGQSQSSTEGDQANGMRAFSENLSAQIKNSIQRSMLPGGDLYAAGVRA